MMEIWLKITTILCAYGVFKEIRPSENYLTEYLEGPWFNLTQSQVNHEIYPVWTYSYLFCLIIVLLVTDFVRYKPVIIVEALGYIATWSLLLWSRSLFAMQMMQATYSIATSTEVAYYTYIYAVVSPDVFQKVTGYARGALLFGKFLSGFSSQVLISTKLADFHSLNYLSFASVSICFLISFALPQPQKTLYRLRTSSPDNDERNCTARYLDSLRFMWRELKRCYTDKNLLLWCVWWSMATSGHLQVGNYIQPLWETVSPTWENSTSETVYNGAVEATHTLLSSGAAITLGMIQEHYIHFNDFVLATFTFIITGMILIMAWTTHIWIAYVTYIISAVIYQMMITVVSFHVAKNITIDTHGLIFGMNTLIAIILQSIITAVFVSHGGFSLDTRMQFTVYSIYFGILGLLFLVVGVYKATVGCRNVTEEDVEKE